jgi:sirohydrochlorin cobaltochelatase
MNDREALAELRYRLDTLLPEEYRGKDVAPVPMGSAGLKYADDGTVAWDQMWASFCDLAMAGGPPHKGALLLPGTRDAVTAKPDKYESVVEEICRGIVLATELQAGWSPDDGWIRVSCYSDAMAGWLLRAITMENVSVRKRGLALDLPAAPDFRLDREIKNVITVVAKTSHYWLGHMPKAQKESITVLLAAMSKESPLIEPEDGWRGVACPSVDAAIWLMRASVAFNMLSRREGTTWFVPVNVSTDASGERVAAEVSRLQHLARASGHHLS